MTPEMFNYYMQGAPEPMPNRAFDPNTGAPVHPNMIRFVVQMQRALERQRQEKQEKPKDAGTRHRSTGGYYGMSGAQRNAMRAMQAQQRFMMNNPQAAMGDPRGQEGYYVNGRHIPVMGPDRVLR